MDYVIIVDNGSNNINQVGNTCNGFSNVVLIELGVNLSFHALNIGMYYATKKFDPEFILLLNDYTIVYPNAVSKVLSKTRDSNLYKIVGAFMHVISRCSNQA